MKKKQLGITFIIVFAIFLLGFFVRLDYIRLPGVPDSDKEFYEGQNGLPYMYELDSYYHYRLTKNFLDHGYIGDTKINGREWDTHSYYPPGVPMDYPPLIIYIAAFVYRFINLFTNVSLISICFWMPAFIGPIAGIVAYFFTRRFINQYGAVAAGLLTVTSSHYTGKTLPGFFDTDMFMVLFPLLVVWFFVEALQSKNMKMRIILAGFSAFSIFVFSITWSGWYYLFYIVFLFSIGYLIWSKLKRNSIKDIGCVLAIFTIGSLLLISIITGFSNIIKPITEPLLFIKMLGKSPWAPWPDVYSHVLELQKSSIKEIWAEIGLPFFIGIIGILFMFRVLISDELKKHFNRIKWFFLSFLLFWISISFLIRIGGGIKFSLLIVSPLVISAGIMIGILIEYPKLLQDSGKFNMLKRKKNLIKIISIAILFFITLQSVLGVHRMITNMIPIANDDLWSVSEWIQNNTPQETVIISNWSYGHLFTAISDRSVSFDGRMGYLENLATRKNDAAFKYGIRSPSTSREYWINRALVTSDDALSYGILRMLATTGDVAYLTLEDYMGNTAKSVEILNNILGLDKETAINRLINNYHLAEEQIETILDLTHPDITIPFVLVTTDIMRENAHFIFNFGEWDFNKDAGQDYTYSIARYDIEKDVLTSKNGISMDM
ncbi:MAG: dolichyl-diphosphooligosaccharide--protein glycosyltransferase subunit STT3, partial [Clostridiaceae bacterium]|nr:dolichyl-diphosphooligosaccharide--protein glycosyltransferase subunit STT3 [Clostridiaceae bacterium]